MIKIGMIIGDRYEILEKIGTGGMSDVYKAKCHKLNRFVAVKVLKQEFSENANFVSKFRIEAQAAAGLMHPNIVNVYDVGEENGIYYIVMELVEGVTLKKYIEKKARLTFVEAMSIGIQVCMGIEAAHNNHIIHRDIKPQNIIISMEGKVKVTDFGIAKAATSNTITSNVMGSVHYTSPEQARGGYSDEKSDIYSWGITMFEMLTGRVPFNGETTVAIAIKHIQEELPSPRDLVEEIPVSVESIVLKCCQKSPDRRYQTMGELIVDLKKVLMNPEEDVVVFVNPDEDNATRFISEEEVGEIKRQTDRGSIDDTLRLRGDTPGYGYEDYAEEDPYGEEDYNPKLERITTILAVVAGIIICFIIIFFVGRITGIFDFGDMDDKITDSSSQTTIESESESESIESSKQESTSESEDEGPEMTKMVSVVGYTVEEATERLREVGLEPNVTYMESDVYEEGIVISAGISAGTRLEVGTYVQITVSSGTSGVEVPDVINLAYETAFNMLAGKGFVVNKVESYSDTVPKGNVISQSQPAETKVAIGSTITVTVSLGKEDTTVRVPNLMGCEEDEAIAILIENNLAVGDIGQMNSETVEEGKVCYQSHSYGAFVERGTAIDFKISMGFATVTYRLNAGIAAPTVDEAPDYVPGSEVRVVITAADGKIVMDKLTTSFPMSANASGIASSVGTITFTYTVTSEGEIITDEEGNQVIVPGTTEEKTFTRSIEFVQE
ncbi:MAG: Stk1 family PASTA domain-containing Ser/Thr kinase [Lachnospiraceae bacterium]|nr:Stk1 family PASTA domain-containing Ser/Thr kinase [Lachnospiraceae bacterium]